MGWGFLDYIPGVANIKDAIQGDWSGALNPLDAQFNIGSDAYHGVKNAVNAPYDEKRQGIDKIQEELAALKKERMARMDQVYGRADSKFDDTRAAMKQLYGDPTSWRL